MKRDAEDILKEALDLPPEGRAAIAGTLLDSLEGEIDEGAEAAWLKEAARRLDELENGKVKSIPWADVRRRLLGK